jgi:hypothetical protein
LPSWSVFPYGATTSMACEHIARAARLNSLDE